MRIDEDLKYMSPGELRRKFAKFRNQFRKIRDAKDDRKCWVELTMACLMLPEKKLPPGYRISKNPKVLMGNCERYWRRECGMRQIERLLEKRRSGK